MDPAYECFYKKLSELPRITREFYYAALSRSIFVPETETYGVREPLIRRLLNISQTMFKEEIQLLKAYKLASVSELQENEYWIILTETFNNELILADIMGFIEDKELDLKKIFVDLDFTCFS